MSDLAKRFAGFMEDSVSLEEEVLGLEDLELELECIDSNLKLIFSELDAHTQLGEKVNRYGLESIDQSELSELYPNLGSESFGSILMTFWDDFFSTRHRLVQGIVDLLRDKKKTIVAYRKKLLAKQKKADIRKLANSQGKHDVTFVSIEKFWLTASGSYPNDILGKLEKDYADTSAFITQTPKDVISALEDLNRTIRGSSSENLIADLDKQSKNLPSPYDVVPDGMPNNSKDYLYRTALLMDKKPDHRDFSSLSSESFAVKLIKGDWANDTFNAALTLIPHLTTIRFVRQIVSIATVIRSVAQYSTKVSSKDLVKINDLGFEYLDSAEQGIDTNIDSLNEINKVTENIGESLKNIEASPEDAKIVSRYITNLTSVVTEPHHQMVERQVKMAKGINYLLMRTVGR